MKAKAAVVWGAGQGWKIEEVEVHPPRRGEVLVNWKFAGLCHSDEHFVTGDVVPPRSSFPDLGIEEFYPILGGHEGAGIVLEVGPEVHRVAVGDHVSTSFVPICGRCRYCSTGHQNLCDQSAGTFVGGMITDGTHRHFVKGQPVTLMTKTGTFSDYACVSEASLVKVDSDLPLECVALVSCGVATGWGSAVERARVRPGDVVAVVGVGGIGINAVQGSKMAGASRIVGIDPVDFKREKALEFGATDVYASMEEALPGIREMTRGQLADQVILTPGVMYGDLLAPAMSLIGKGGVAVVTAVAPISQRDVTLDLFELAMWNKDIRGTIFGSLNPGYDIPRLLERYRDGSLLLDQLITKRYTIDELNEGYRAMRDGENLRGLLVH